MLTLILSIATPIIAILALIIALMSWRTDIRTSRFAEHFSHIMDVESMFAHDARLLRFHGINRATIKREFGVRPNELTYLLLSFDAGEISYLISNKHDKEPFKEGSYRYNMLKNADTQRAFPLIEKLFESDSLYLAKCKKTIYVINHPNP